MSDIRRLSVEAPAILEAKRRPKSGFTTDNKQMFKYRYKHAIRVARDNFEQNLRNKLAEKLQNGDSSLFWSVWNAELGNQKSVNTSFGGIGDASKVAQGFF